MKRIRKCPLEDREPDQAADEKDSEQTVDPAGEPVESKEKPAEAGEKENQFCFLKGIVDCSSGRIQDCNMKRTRICPLEEDIRETARKAAESKKRQQEAEEAARKKREEAEAKETARKKREEAEAEANAVRKEEINEGKTAGGQGHSQSFCFLKGLVDCMPCDVQDCNMKRVKQCPLD